MRCNIFYLSIIVSAVFCQVPCFSQNFPVFNPKRSIVSVPSPEMVQSTSSVPNLYPPYVSVSSFIGGVSSFFESHDVTYPIVGVMLELMLGSNVAFFYAQSKYSHILTKSPYSVDFLVGVGTQLYDLRNSNGIGASAVMNFGAGSKFLLDSGYNHNFHPLTIGFNNRFRYHFAPFFSFLFGFDLNFEFPLDLQSLNYFFPQNDHNSLSNFVIALEYIFTLGFSF